MSENIIIEGGGALIREPLIATVTLRRIGDSQPIFEFEAPSSIQPGDTVSFEFPKDGIRVDYS